MSIPIHKTCYRCSRRLPEFVDNRDPIGGETGICPDCNITLGAKEVARKWHILHPELPCVPIPDGAAEASNARVCEACGVVVTTPGVEGACLCELCSPHKATPPKP